LGLETNVIGNNEGSLESEAGFELTGFDQKANSQGTFGPATGIESLLHNENRCGAILENKSW
jgi:hypothetical protein